jgi:hypothetical protein
MSAQQLPRKKVLENLRGHVLGDDRVVTLVVGEIVKWTAQGRTMPDAQDHTYVDFEDLTVETIEAIQPDVIVSPLVTENFDAYQVARQLASILFHGRYRAIAPHLPNIDMIRREISSAAPKIDFEIVVMPPKLVLVT